MCGICGEVVFNDGQADVVRVSRMADAMEARGPDGMSVTQRGRVAFGHRRLKIIDLSEPGTQPMTDMALGLTLVFNGCIYNYQDLRTELVSRGYSFFSTSDTEIILKAWKEWGKDCFSRFHGMFAVAIHEHESGRIHLARDRFGIKPLYLSEADGRLGFASSLPALLAGGGIDTSIDRVALHHYMSWHAVVPAPRTILNGVRKLPAATVRTIETDGRSNDTAYWEPVFEKSAEDHARTADEWRDMALESLRTALITFGVDASHGYERIHMHALRSLAELATGYTLSPVEIQRDAREFGSLKGFTRQPTEDADQTLNPETEEPLPEPAGD